MGIARMALAKKGGVEESWQMEKRAQQENEAKMESIVVLRGGTNLKIWKLGRESSGNMRIIWI
jgi:hypothetical protein